MTKWVTIPGTNGKRTVYHTNKDCGRILSEVREASKSEIEWHELTECEWCKNGAQGACNHD